VSTYNDLGIDRGGALSRRRQTSGPTQSPSCSRRATGAPTLSGHGGLVAASLQVRERTRLRRVAAQPLAARVKPVSPARLGLARSIRRPPVLRAKRRSARFWRRAGPKSSRGTDLLRCVAVGKAAQRSGASIGRGTPPSESLRDRAVPGTTTVNRAGRGGLSHR
jgi:hypothetical protein